MSAPDRRNRGSQRKSHTACQNCGNFVSRDYRRTFGDEDNIAHRCSACDSPTRIHKGSAAGKTVSHTDPQDRQSQSADYEQDWRTEQTASNP
ncbi:DUF7563 family protein [Halosimplex sp. J119]